MNFKSLYLGSNTSLLRKIKKIVLKCLFLLFYKTMNHFSIRLWHVTKSGFYTTARDDQLSGWTVKKLQSISQSQSAPQKRSMVTVWWSAAGPIHYSFLILAKPLYLRSMLSKLLRCTRNCNACSRHWSTEWAQFFSATMPDHTPHNQRYKSWMNWATKFCLICHIHQTSLYQIPLF